MLFSNKFYWLKCNSIYTESSLINLKKFGIPSVEDRVNQINITGFYKKFLELSLNKDFSLNDLIGLMGIYLYESIAKPYVDVTSQQLGTLKFSVSNFSLMQFNSNKGLVTKYGEIDSMSLIARKDNNNSTLIITSVKSNLSRTNQKLDTASLDKIFSLYIQNKYTLASNNPNTNKATILNSYQYNEINKILALSQSENIECIYIRAFNKINEAEKKYNELDVGFAFVKNGSILVQFEPWQEILFSLAKKYPEIEEILRFLDSKEIIEYKNIKESSAKNIAL